MTAKTEHLRKLISTYAMRSGEEFKRGLPTVIREAHTSECWRDAVKPDGQKYESFIEWLTTPPPPGCGLGATPDSFTFADVLAICEKVAPDVAKILAGEAKKGKPGRKKAEANGKVETNGAARNQFDRHGTMKRVTLAARLQQEHPSTYQAFLDGKHGSIRAAAEAAGLVKPGHDPMMRCKAYWKKLTKAQRQEFLQWIEGDGK